MNFDESEIVAAGMIGFDMIEGPNISWYKEFQQNNLAFDMENFLMNFYLSFRGGDEELQPMSILYDGFYIVAFPRGLELCCLFMRPGDIYGKIGRLQNIAEELIRQMDLNGQQEIQIDNVEGQQDRDEIERIVVNLLNQTEMSTPELRRYFKITNSEIWTIMSTLERENRVLRTQKVGRTQFWTSI